MAQATNYDAIVIGSSWGGRLLPTALAKAGLKVALIERGYVGGTCINVGCTPPKRWLPAHASPLWQGVALSTASTLE